MDKNEMKKTMKRYMRPSAEAMTLDSEYLMDTVRFSQGEDLDGPEGGEARRHALIVEDDELWEDWDDDQDDGWSVSRKTRSLWE